LGITDALAGGGTHFPASAFWNFRRGGWFRCGLGATVQHLADLAYFTVDAAFLFFKANQGSV
jgi:hypothetical protein